jgi:hypothetical protein
MTTAQGDNSGPEFDDVIAALRRLSLSDMPSVEILLLDEIEAWIFSDSNPGYGYSEKHAAMVSCALLTAVERAGSFRSVQTPAESEEIVKSREKVIAGAHELAEADDGLTLLLTRLMPAATGELERNPGKPAAQAYWLYYYSLLMLAAGTSEAASVAAMRGIPATFDAWKGIMEDGFVLPWRRQQSIHPGKPDNHGGQGEPLVSAEMVTSHVETLIERLTGVEKARPDADGDYPIRYRSALYYVRVAGSRTPVVQLFSIAVDGIRFTDALARDINEINTELHFCRTFWVRDQVLVEAEHLGPTLTEADFHECAFNVAEATDAFAGKLAERHGGRLAFDEAKAPEYTTLADDGVGFYL